MSSYGTSTNNKLRTLESEMPRRSSGIYIWATFGAIMCVYLVYLFGSWMLGPDFVTNTVGRAESPSWVVTAARVTEVLSVLTFLIVNYIFVYKPWRRTGELSHDALFVFACATLYWLDNCMNYTSYFAQLNSNFVNFGNWVYGIPGWQTPNMNKMPEAVIAWGFAYSSWFVLLPMIWAAKIMAYTKSRFPKVSTLEMVGTAFVAMMIFDFILEGTLVRFHMYTYGGAIRAFSLWPGEVHQFPLYESVLWGGAWTMFGCLYYFRDDKGNTWVEQGVDRLKVGKSAQKFIRFLALVGAANAIFLTYAIFINYIQLNSDKFPDNMPSYLVAGLCGEGTPYTCPDPDFPLAKRSAPTNRTIPMTDKAINP